MNEIHVTVAGRLVAEPESRATRSASIPFAAFRLASSSRRLNPKTAQYEDSPANYVNVTAFRALGMNAAASLHRGDPVIVHGRMRVNQFTRSDGSPGTSVEVDAYSIGHDLSWGTSDFTKVRRAQADRTDRLADDEVQSAHAGFEEGSDDDPEGAGAGLEDRLAGHDPETDPYVMDDGMGRPGVDPFGDADHREEVLTTA